MPVFRPRFRIPEPCPQELLSLALKGCDPFPFSLEGLLDRIERPTPRPAPDPHEQESRHDHP